MNLLFILGLISVNFAQEIPNIPSLNILKFYTLQSNTELSKLCKAQSDIYYNSLVSSDFKQMWSKKMIDSSSKIQSGILSGNLLDLGTFDQCLAVNNQKDDIKGKFCYTKLTISIPKIHKIQDDIEIIDPKFMNLIQPFIHTRTAIENNTILFRWSFCVPNGCSADDVKAHLNSYFHQNISLPIPIPNLFDIEENDCHSLDTIPKLNTGDWTVIGIVITIFCIIVVSTTYDVYLYYTKREATHKILIAFSWYTNLKSLSKINNNSDQLPCLNGIRFLSILWIIHGHELSTLILGIVNSNDVKHWAQWELWSWFTFGSTVAVDTFFVLSGCLLMYGFLKSQAKNVPFNIPIFYIHRYLRLTPAFAATVIFYATLLNHMGTGPLWNGEVGAAQSRCKKYWWSSLLYIQNYVNPYDHCIIQSWYLSVDMQLYILSPIILLSVKKWPKYVPHLFTCLMIIFTIIPTIVAWVNNLTIFSSWQDNFYKVYYVQFYTRAGPWIFGLLLGYILFNTKDTRIKINKFLVAFLWILSGFTILFIVFSNYKSLRDDYENNKLYNAVFIGLHRNIWAFAIGWIIFSCIHGYGGPVNWFLSLSMFQFFAKLTYSLYLIHGSIQSVRLGSLRANKHFSNMSVLFSYFGTTCLSLIITIMWVLTFEYPFGVIANILISGIMNLTKRDSHRKDSQN